MAGGWHLVNIGNNYLVTNDIICHIIHIIHNHIVAKIAVDNNAVIETNRHPQIVKLKEKRFQFPYADQPEKFAAFNQFRIKFVGYQKFIPVIAGISVPNQYFNFMGI